MFAPAHNDPRGNWNWKLDSNESIYFGTELTYIYQKTFDKLYPELRARDVFPVDYSPGPGAESFKWYQFDQVGVAKVVNNYAKDFPRASIKGKEFIGNIKSLGASFGYTIQEIRAAMFVGRPLQEREANAARRAVLYQENQIAFNGDDANQLPGFLSNPNIPQTAVAADGDSSVDATKRSWASKTPDQIIRDVNVALRNIPKTTKGVERANTVLLPIDQYELIASTPRSSISDTTILSFLKGVHPGVEFTWLPFELVGSGPSTTDQMICYRRDPDKIFMVVAQEYEQFDPQLEGMEYEVPVHERFGGVVVPYPLSASFSYGI